MVDKSIPSPFQKSSVLILNFGSQTTQLLARRVRELGVYAEIGSADMSMAEIKKIKPSALILSGGPASVFEKTSPKRKDLFNLKIPVLGVCYGMQMMAQELGGAVLPAKIREYGPAQLQLQGETELLPQINGPLQVWMSHGDEVGQVPKGFHVTAVSHNQSPAAMEDPSRKLYGVQFHPEVEHSIQGKDILKNFLFKICGLQPSWSMGRVVPELIHRIREQVGTNHVLCALSGGVDSTVAAKLVSEAIGDRLHCVFVDNGLLRLGEAERVREWYDRRLRLHVSYVDASQKFLSALDGVDDPEKKRKIIGREFIRVFEKFARSQKPRQKFLVQGTLYPDVIESSGASFSKNIKSHHNVGGLPKKLDFKLVEPLRDLFKDEVRELGRELGLPSEIIDRHPFPGPGLAVRVVGRISEERLRRVRLADQIFMEEVQKAGLYKKLWQAFAVDLPVKTVGVKGDGRAFEEVIALRAVLSQDGMTADWARIDYDVLQQASSRILNEVAGVTRVVYDISTKPPATIEWE